MLFKSRTNLDFKLPDSFLKSESELVIISSWFTCDAFVFFRLFYIIEKIMIITYLSILLCRSNFIPEC